MILGVEVALDDDVEVRDLGLTPRVEAEAAVKGVDVLVGEFKGLKDPLSPKALPLYGERLRDVLVNCFAAMAESSP